MQLETGNLYEVHNLRVPQGTPGAHPRITIHDIIEYEGECLVYGTKLVHQQHVYLHGVQTIRDKAVGFAVLRGEPVAQNILKLSDELRGQHLGIGLVHSRDILYILNWASRLGALWWTEEGKEPNRDELLRRAQIAVDVYHEWKRLGHLPPWFVSKRAVSQN